MHSLRLVSILFCALGTSSAAPNLKRHADLEARCAPSTCATCPVPVDIPVEAPKPNPFKALTGDEIASVESWLMSTESLGLNLTDLSSGTLALSDNYIAQIEVLKPNKTDVLSYLDCNGTVPRYARVVLNHGAHDPPTVSEYSVSLPAFYFVESLFPVLTPSRLGHCPSPTRLCSSLWIGCTTAPMARVFC